MKKMILCIYAIALFSISAYGAEVIWQKSTDSNTVQYEIRCNNGSQVSIFYYRTSQRYHNGNFQSWTSLQDAVSGTCN